MRRNLTRIIILFNILVIATCLYFFVLPDDRQVKESKEGLFLKSLDQGQIVKFDSLFKFKWDKMYYLSTYFNREELKRCGLKGKIRKTDLDDNDGQWGFLFANDGNVQKIFVFDYDVPRFLIDRKSVCGIERSSANFTVEIRANDSFTYLKQKE